MSTLTMRRRMRLFSRDPYTCCCCLHVKTGTIVLGVWHFVAQTLVVLSILMSLFYPNQFIDDGGIEINKTSEQVITTNGRYLTFWQETRYDVQRKLSPENQAFMLLLTIPYMCITYMLVYGATKERAQYLLPFFCIQVFDFVLSCLTMLGYFSSSVAVKEWIMSKDVPFKEQLLEVDTHLLMLALIVVVALALTLKAYFINVVWMCYKYLSDAQSSGAETGLLGATEAGADLPNYLLIDRSADSDAEALLPPKYEDAIKIPKSQLVDLPPPPPPYGN